jgi:hypothetical protein
VARIGIAAEAEAEHDEQVVRRRRESQRAMKGLVAQLDRGRPSASKLS